MKKLNPLCLIFAVSITLASCETDPINNDDHSEFKYTLGSSPDYRMGIEAAFYHSVNDSTGRMKVKFANYDMLDFVWMTKCYSYKTSYLFGQYYGVDSDIMINEFKNNESAAPYWVLDQGIYKSGNLTFTSWTNDRVEGTFDFNANTMNPVDLSTQVLNFKGSFNIPVKQ